MNPSGSSLWPVFPPFSGLSISALVILLFPRLSLASKLRRRSLLVLPRQLMSVGTDRKFECFGPEPCRPSAALGMKPDIIYTK